MNFQVKCILTDRLFRNVRACSILSLRWNVLDPLSRGYEIQAKYITQKYQFFFKVNQKFLNVILRAYQFLPGEDFQQVQQDVPLFNVCKQV